MQRQKTIEMRKKHSPKTPVVGITSKYSVCRTREARYSGKTTKATRARTQKCSTSFPVPIDVHKTVGAKSPYHMCPTCIQDSTMAMTVVAKSVDLTSKTRHFDEL